MAQSGYCKVNLIGRIGRDAETRALPSGATVANFNVAYTDRDDNTYWYRVALFGKLAEALSPHLVKGREVYVEGELRPEIYEGKNGPSLQLNLRASEVRLIGGRGASAESEGEQVISFDE